MHALVTAPGPIRGKRELRQTARDARDAIPAATRAAASLAIADAVDRELLARLPPQAIVALYAPVASEVDTRPIGLRALARHLRVAYPRVLAPHRLAFALAAPDELERGAFKIPEPRADAPIVSPDAFIVPGIAFDRTGARIGWGHGYYDATLAAAPAALRCGVAFESQLVAYVPVDPTDAHVHVVITERAVHRCAIVPGAPWIP
ncbi:MAG TPA: 5-formyltetrahydrofolate cyclo-ligase [Kofleriaceae bacterium]|nr:5-formyltetrahydrofolate cyclo-ligase [Kofleriaceae bacterium]